MKRYLTQRVDMPLWVIFFVTLAVLVDDAQDGDWVGFTIVGVVLVVSAVVMAWCVRKLNGRDDG